MKHWTKPPSNNHGQPINTGARKLGVQVITAASVRSSSKLAGRSRWPVSGTKHR